MHADNLASFRIHFVTFTGTRHPINTKCIHTKTVKPSMEAEYLELQITSFREQILHGAYAYPRPGDFRK